MARKYPPFESICAKQVSYKDDFAPFIRDLKDRYRGKRCFVVGNGPSLKWTPLDKLIGEYSIATNKISEVYSRTHWRPTHFLAVSINTLRWIDQIRATVELGIPSFLLWRRAEDIGYYPNIIWVERIHGPHFRMDITDGLNNKMMSGANCVQLAIHLGFNPIYLVGFDASWKSYDEGEDDPNHIRGDYLDKVTEEQAKRFNRYHMSNHRMIRMRAKEQGIEIYDCTINSAYPRLDLNGVLDG